MADEPIRRFTLQQYAGLITATNAHFIPPDAFQACLNVDLVQKGEFDCRKGILPAYPANAIAPTSSFQAIASFGFSLGQAEILIYETRDGSLHYSVNPTTAGSGHTGAPVMRTGLNSFEPLTMIKVPDGFMIGTNGIDRPLFWDGLSPQSYNEGMDAPLTAPNVINASGQNGGATGGPYVCYVRFLDQYLTPSNFSPATNVTANAGDAFLWSGIPVSPNPRCVWVELWRTTAGEADTFFLVTRQPNGTTSFKDILGDVGLEQEAALNPYDSMVNEINGQPNANRFGIPPSWKTVCSWFQDRCFYLADINYDIGNVTVVNGSALVFASGAAWTPQMSGLYLNVAGATMPYLIDAVAIANAGVTEINHGGGSTNAVQRVTVSTGITGGTFTLTLSGQTTTAIAYNASAATVQTDIAALSNVGSGNVAVTGSSGGPWTVTFQGALAGLPEPAMTSNSSGLTGATITVTELQHGSGSGSGSAVQVVGFGTADGFIIGGQFTLSFNGHTTPPIPALGTTAAQMQTILQALPSIGSGNCTVVKSQDVNFFQEWQITFTGFLAGLNLPQMTITCFPTSTSTGVTYTGTLEPENYTQVTGAAGANEIQQIKLPSGVTGGTFTLTWSAQTTTGLAWNCLASDVQGALAALAAIGPGNVAVTGGLGTFNVIFQGTLGGAPQTLITGSGTNLTGLGVTVQVLQPGGSGTSGTQTITLPAATCGTWTITCNGATTTPLQWNALATDVQNALQALSTVGAGNVTVTGTYNTLFTLTFGAALSATPITQVNGDGTFLCGLPATVVELAAGASGGGGPAQNEVQLIGWEIVQSGFVVGCGSPAYPNGVATNSTFTLTFNGHTTAPIAVYPNPLSAAGPTAAQIQTILQGLPNIGAGNVSVVDLAITGAAAGLCGVPLNAGISCYSLAIQAWQITFTGTLSGAAQPQITINVGSVNAANVIAAFPGAQVLPIQCVTQQGSGGGGGGCINELQSVTLPTGTSGGTFTITAAAVTTAPLAWNATASQVQAALGNNFSVTLSGQTYYVTYINALGCSPRGLATVNTNSLTGGIITSAVVSQGQIGGNEVQLVLLGLPTGGTYTLTFEAQTTTPLAYNATAAQVQTALQALSTIGSGNVAVTYVGGAVGGGGGSGACNDGPAGTGQGTAQAFVVTFQGALGNASQPLMTIGTGSLVGPLTVQTLTLDTPYKGPTKGAAAYSIRPAPVERNRIYFSSANEPEAVPSVNELRVQHDQNVDDEIVGAMPFNGTLYILKENHIYGLTYVSQPLIDVAVHPVAYRGALNNRCCAIAEGVMFLMDEWGAYAFDGQNVTKIGDPIQNYWREGLIDLSRSKWFHVHALPQEQTVRFFVCFPGYCYPAHAFAYNYRLATWSLEQYHKQAPTAAYMNFDGDSRLLLGTTGEVFYQMSEGTLDGTLGQGTIRGFATTSSNTNKIICSVNTWPPDVTTAAITIDSGGAKAQTRAVIAANTSTFTLTLDRAFTGQAKNDTYVLGGIPWFMETPIFRFAEVPDANRREIRVSFIPTPHPATFDTQRTYDHNSSPLLAPQTQPPTGVWPISWKKNSPDITADMCSTQSRQTQIVGFVPISDDQRLDDRTEGPRWITWKLRGVQAQDRIRIVGITIMGVETG